MQRGYFDVWGLFKTVPGRVILPFLLVVLLMEIGAIYLVSTLVSWQFEDRVHERLTQSSQATWHVFAQIDESHLRIIQALLMVEGIGPSIERRDVAELHALMGPVTHATRAPYIDVFAPDGEIVVSVRSGEPFGKESSDLEREAPNWSPVAEALRDLETNEVFRYGAMVVPSWGSPRLLTAVPATADGRGVGVIAVASPIEGAGNLIRRLEEETAFRDVTIYGLDGAVVATTSQLAGARDGLQLEGGVARRLVTDNATTLRRVDLDVPYIEVLSPAVFGGRVGFIFGVGETLRPLDESAGALRATLSVMFSIAVLAVLGVGLWTARSIGRDFERLEAQLAETQRGSIEPPQ